MQDNSLFNGDDSRQRGVRCDRLGTKKDGLTYKWEWSGDGPCQVCSAKLKREGVFTFNYGGIKRQFLSVELRVIFWHSYYEAVLRIGDNRFSSVDNNKFSHGEDVVAIVTRVEGQRVAEDLLAKFYSDLTKLLK